MGNFITVCNLRSLTIGLCATLTLGSCLPDPLEVQGIEAVKPEIVVSTQLASDESIVVLLTKTFGALDASETSDPEKLINQIAVNDALVTIQGGGRKDTLYALGNGLYGSIAIPFVHNQDYQLDVISISLGKVSAVTTALPQISFDQIDAELDYTEFNDTLAQVNYALNDPTEKNWYMINVKPIEADELLEDILNPRVFTRLFDDTDFEGDRFGEIFRVFPRDFAPGDTIGVYLSNISEAYYNFVKLRQDNRYNFVEYISEPINYPTNIKGGRGFFNLHIPDVHFIVLE